MRKLIFYPNCSKGGVSTVIRGRAKAEPSTHFDAIFLNARGGEHVFDDLPNVTVRILRKDRLDNFLRALTQQIDYDEFYVLSSPNTANVLSENDENLVTYEFHSSNMDIVEKEISELALDRLASIAVPSEQMRGLVSVKLPKRIRRRLIVEPNLVDSECFKSEGPSSFLDNVVVNNQVPIVWVGRFDIDKGYHYALRVLAQLPTNFVGVFVVSLENDPDRASKFFAESDAMGVRDRVHLYMNLTQQEMSNLYRAAAKRDGYFISTSLMESFGYAIAEALSCSLPTVAFSLPILSLHHELGELIEVPIGDVNAMANSLSSRLSIA